MAKSTGVFIACIVALSSAAAVLLAAASQDEKAAAEWPCVAVWHQDGMKAKPNDGLRIAVWEDGTILFSPRPDRLGEHMLVGRVEKKDVETMLAGLRAAGFWDEHRSDVVPDSAYTTIAASDGQKRTVHRWHEYLLPGFGSDINTDKDYRAFVRMWKRTSGAIEALPPIEVRRLSDELGEKRVFRGYIADKPHETVWRQ